MNRSRTKQYYRALPAEEICNCAYCQTYVRNVRAAYPEAAAFLASLGADIEKPLETCPVDEDEHTVLYVGAQYVICGSAAGFRDPGLPGLECAITAHHPNTGVRGRHFVIELSPLRLRRDT